MAKAGYRQGSEHPSNGHMSVGSQQLRTKYRVVASLDRESIDLSPAGSTKSFRVPIRLIPADLRLPNAEFWLDSDTGGVLRLFRHEHDQVAARSGRWLEHQG